MFYTAFKINQSNVIFSNDLNESNKKKTIIVYSLTVIIIYYL